MLGFERHYLVKMDSLRFQLPDICPVCSQATEAQGEILAISQHDKRRMVGTSAAMIFRNRYIGPGSRTSVGPPIIRRFSVPTCAKHAQTPDRTSRRRGFLGFISGVATMLTLVVGAFIAFSWYDGNVVPLEWYILATLSVSIMLGSFVALGPTQLERAISVYDVMPGVGVVILKVKNKEYRDEILRLNPTKSQPVRKARTTSL